MKKLVLVIALLLVIPVMLVGCSTSESAGVKNSINGFADAFNDKDYEKCTDYILGVTDATRDAAEAEVEAIALSVESMEVVSIEEIDVDGSAATAKVTVKAKLTALLGGATIEDSNEVSLTKEDGTWKFSLGDLVSPGG